MFGKSFLILSGVIGLFLWAETGAKADNSQVQAKIIHFPVTTGQEREDIHLEAKIEGYSEVIYFRIYYRKKGEESYQYVEMEQGLEGFTGSIPGNEVRPPVLEYFLTAVLTNQQMLTSPEFNPYYAPYEITISSGPPSRPEPAEGKPSARPALEAPAPVPAIGELADLVLILSPEPAQTVTPEDALISVSILDETQVDVKSVKVYLDEKDVTSSAEITSHLVSLVPEKLKGGTHRVAVTFRDRQGKDMTPLRWSFQVLQAGFRVSPEKPGKKSTLIRGNVFTDLKNENISGRTLAISVVGANFSGNFGAIHYSGRIYKTSREKKDQQPRDRYTFGIGTRWLGANFGDVNPRFNDLMLWGKRVRGLEAYLKLGFFNVEFVQGETARGVKGVTFKQTLMGIRPSFGSGRNFQLGFNLVKVKEDTTHAAFTRTTPKDNIVLGSDILLAFANHRIEFRAGAAFSLMTTDISTGPLTKAGIDTTFETDIPFDPADYEKYLILNASTTPLNPGGLSSLAYNTSFKFDYFGNLFQFDYKSIGSEYISLGNSFLRKGIRGFAITDRLRLYRNQLFLTLGFEKYQDNFAEENRNPSTDLQTYNFAVSFFPRSDLPKVNLGFKNHNRNNGISELDIDTTITNIDTLDNRLNNNSRDLSFQIGYDLNVLNLDHSISFSIINSYRKDKYDNSRLANYFPQNLDTDIRMISLKTKYHVPLTTCITYAYTGNKYGKQTDFKYSTLDLRADYFLFNKQLKTSGGLKSISASDFKKTGLWLGATFQWHNNHTFLLDANFYDFKQGDKHFNDNTVRFRYELRF